MEEQKYKLYRLLQDTFRFEKMAINSNEFNSEVFKFVNSTNHIAALTKKKKKKETVVDLAPMEGNSPEEIGSGSVKESD